MLTRPYSMLIIDDEEDMCDFLESVITDHLENDISVVSSTSTRDALNQLDTKQFHIILTDLNMPGHSGYEIVKKALDKDKSVQVIFLTGDVQMSTALTCFRDGAAAMLTKPIDPTKILKVVCMCMERLDYWSEIFKRFSSR